MLDLDGMGRDVAIGYALTWQQLKLPKIVNLWKYSNYEKKNCDVSNSWIAFLQLSTLNQICEHVCKFVCMLAWFVGPKTIFRPESFITEVAGDDNSFEMVCFNVISNVSAMALFSTYFANIRKLMSIGTSVLTFLHHWIHLVVKFLKVHRIVSRNGQCSIFSKIVDISVGCLPSQRPRNLQTSTFLFPLSRFWKRDWKQPRSLCVPPPADHPHRPESHQQSYCPLSSFQKPFWCFPGSHSTEGTAFQTCQCCSLWEFIWTQVRGQNTGQGQK